MRSGATQDIESVATMLPPLKRERLKQDLLQENNTVLDIDNQCLGHQGKEVC